MLGNIEYTINELFKQLGLDCGDEAIETFIKNHQLSATTKLIEAPFWSDQQRAFLQEQSKLDAVWSLTIDELNVRLHEQNMSS